VGDIDVLELTTGLVGGLALFLLGIQQLTRAMQNATSNRLRTLLVRLSGTPLRGAISGTLAAGLIQSSTATVVLIIGFVVAGAMSLVPAVGVVLGANLGTTLTIQLIAFDVTRFALLMIAVGFAVSSIKRLEPIRSPGRMLMALGLIFFGMDVMAGGVAPLQQDAAVADMLADTSAIVLGLVVGAALTALVQSSSATSGIVVVLAAQGLVDLEVGIAILMGASIGHCVTPIIAGLGTARSGLRVAVIHAMANALGVAVAVWLIPQLAGLAAWMSPSHPELSGTAREAAETPRQLANAYTVFKLGMLVLFLPFSRSIARLTERLVPDRPQDERPGARYLDDDVLDTPDVALELARRELGHLGEEVAEVVDQIMPTVLHGSEEELTELEALDSRVDAIHADLLRYLGDIGLQEISDEHGDELLRAITIANDLESIGDIVQTNMVQVGHRRLRDGVVPSEPTTEAVGAFHGLVADRLWTTVGAIADADVEVAREIADSKGVVEDQRLAVSRHLFVRLRADAPNRVRSYEREAEVISHLQRISALTRHVAQMLVAEQPRPTSD
jgi:phosphate:Na+ symporter